MASWTTEAEVLALTGTTVTAAQLTHAQGVIDLFAGVTLAALPNLSPRNIRLLKLAAGYQAAWQVAQVDVPSRTEVQQVQQDGVSFSTGHPDALVLAPLARRALAQLSWRRNRTVRVEAGCVRYPNWEQYAAAWLRDESPDSDWRPVA